jgi:hypothetical protein
LRKSEIYLCMTLRKPGVSAELVWASSRQRHHLNPPYFTYFHVLLFNFAPLNVLHLGRGPHLPHSSYVTILNLLVPVPGMNVSSPDCTVPNIRTIRGWGVEEGDKGWGFEINWGAITAFTWGDWGTRLKPSVTIDGTYTRDLPNTKQGCHTLRQRSVLFKTLPIGNPLMRSLGVS